MNALENVKTKLKPGQVYRRADLEKLSRSVDRDVAGLVNEGVLVKVGSGLYQCPQLSRFGVLPASTDKLLTSFLKDDDYLVTSPNDYNALGLGTSSSTTIRSSTTTNGMDVLNLAGNCLSSTESHVSRRKQQPNFCWSIW